ncbi:hypothetical protein CQ14_22230 [Bradyrhizobium lablabi]|uniref:Uncharacterized protein n=1 Tax=Bradyrhizobium lablabi TaxID=722472 RepID=A0A0R3MLU9_9BRAD|nr:hypothetical protein CQ14_22230 [Bradyrhizobium lablabi]
MKTRPRQMFLPVDAGEPRLCSLMIRPHVGAAMAANRADEQGLQIGQPQALGPAVSVYHNRMRALVVAAAHMQPASAGPPHLPKGDRLLK